MWCLRLALVAVGVVVFLAVTGVVVLVAMAWALRALWARVTGQPVRPLGAWAQRVNPRSAFKAAYQSGDRWRARSSAGASASASAQDANPRSAGGRARALLGEREAVVDVQARDLS